VWIYGGAFTTRDSDNKMYYGNAIANNEDIVMVSLLVYSINSVEQKFC
jgi:carboxylesterase type B